MKVLEKKESSLKEPLKEGRLSFQNLERLEKWLKENVVRKGKREIVKGGAPSQRCSYLSYISFLRGLR